MGGNVSESPSNRFPLVSTEFQATTSLGGNIEWLTKEGKHSLDF